MIYYAMCLRVVEFRDSEIMDNLIELLILSILSAYYIYGSLQIFTALNIKRAAARQYFPDKDHFVSIIIPVYGTTSTTRRDLNSVCIQDHGNYEVIFVAEKTSDPAFKIARGMANRYPHVRIVLSGSHDPRKNIAKCHNLVYAVKHAKGEVLLFGDSDGTYSRDWIRKMTYPLGEEVQGRRIHATTSPFFIEPETPGGKIVSLPVSFVAFTTSFTRESQRFSSWASGGSMAIERELFERLKISKIWDHSFNDDLVLARALMDNGYNIYNQHTNINHTHEAISGFRQIMNKLIRWVVTVSTFGHGNLKRETPLLIIKNLQWQVSLVIGMLLYLLGFSFTFVLLIIIAGYLYSVLFRWGIGIIVEEKGMGPYYPFNPIMGLAMLFFYVLVKTFYRGFSWEGKRYTL
jgi:cellulose synthase/poly-beta-1,6-N-acetylglucosamine synthase-like glycosyltransferase